MLGRARVFTRALFALFAGGLVFAESTRGEVSVILRQWALSYGGASVRELSTVSRILTELKNRGWYCPVAHGITKSL